jgi:gp16 family phage-associated protein
MMRDRMDKSVQEGTSSDLPGANTCEDAQRWFRERGMAVSDWALERRFNPSLVYAVLHGRRKALRGRSFEIAVALGLKARPCD